MRHPKNEAVEKLFLTAFFDYFSNDDISGIGVVDFRSNQLYS